MNGEIESTHEGTFYGLSCITLPAPDNQIFQHFILQCQNCDIIEGPSIPCLSLAEDEDCCDNPLSDHIAKIYCDRRCWICEQDTHCLYQIDSCLFCDAPVVGCELLLWKDGYENDRIVDFDEVVAAYRKNNRRSRCIRNDN